MVVFSGSCAIVFWEARFDGIYMGFRYGFLFLSVYFSYASYFPFSVSFFLFCLVFLFWFSPFSYL